MWFILFYNCCGDLVIYLVSFMGICFILLVVRLYDYFVDGFNDWVFMIIYFWDEDFFGEWVLEIENISEVNNYGMLIKFIFVFYGIVFEGLFVFLESSGCKIFMFS